MAKCAELTDDLAEAIFAAGCDDAGPWQSQETVFIGFDREAASFEEAVLRVPGD